MADTGNNPNDTARKVAADAKARAEQLKAQPAGAYDATKDPTKEGVEEVKEVIERAGEKVREQAG